MNLRAKNSPDQSIAGLAGHRLLSRTRIPLCLDGLQLSVSAMLRDGPRSPILFLHGFGSTKEDFADAGRQKSLDSHMLVSYDAAACGRTECSDAGAVDIPLLVELAKQVVSHFELSRIHLVGHSMGGLAALLLADSCPDSFLSFTNIEGNLAPEDCFLSRQIIDRPNSDAGDFFDEFVNRLWHARDPASALYAERVRSNVHPEAVGPIFRSMVDLTDQGRLLDRFVSLPCAKMFMYGESSQPLSYLQALADGGVELAGIAHCGHFPMYSNPPAMWRELTRFISECESSSDRSHA